MKLIGYEIYKILKRRVILIFLAIMLVLDIFVCFNSCINKYEYTKEIKSVFEMYDNEPEKTIMLAENIEKAYDEMMTIVFEALRNYKEIDTTTVPGLYFETLNKDHAVFGNFLENIEYTQSFKTNIQKVIDTAKYNLREYETLYENKDSYIFQQQIKSIQIYEKLKYIPVKPVYNTGWEKYFLYNAVNIFIFFAALIICSEAFAVDSPLIRVVIRSSKKGRKQTFIVKIGAVFILNFIISLMFSITSLFVIGNHYGLSDLTEAIQSVQSFMLCPVNLTILGYFILSFFIRLLVISAFSAILLFISVYNNQIITYVTGILFISVNYILTIIRYSDDNNVFKNINFYSASNANYLFTRYRTFNFFDNAIEYIPVTVFLYFVVYIVFTIITMKIYLKRGGNFIKLKFPVINLNLIDIIRKYTNRKSDKVNNKTYIKSLLGWEIYKVLFSKRLLYFISILIIINIYISYNENKPIVSYSNNAYIEFNEILHGEVTEEKGQWLINEKQRLNDIISGYEQIKENYITQKISSEEYINAFNEYNIAVSRSTELSVIEERYNYLTGIKNTKNIDGWFLYDTGWYLLLFKDFDIILFACLLLLFGGLFSDEYGENDNFFNILHSCKNGRLKLFKAKIFTVFILTSFLFFLFKGIELIMIINNFGLTDSLAPLVSMPSFKNTNNEITIFQFTALYYTISYFSWLALALLTAGLSSIFHGKTSTITIISVVTLFPMFFSVFNFHGFDKFDITQLISGTGIYINSTSMQLFKNDLTYLILFTYIFYFISIISNRFTWNKYK